MRNRLLAPTVAALGITLAAGLTLVGCADASQKTAPASDAHAHGGHHGMDHPMDGGPVPAGMKEASNPKYPVGTKVTLQADHMPGMDGATATIVGGYTTNTYAIDYTPVGGGAPVKDHKWVVQEELQDAGEDRLADGAEVTVTANHMEGMEGAKATIASSTDETVYVVDFEADGMTMTNHKWVTESEISPVAK